MDVAWTVVCCPIQGSLGEQLNRDAERMPEPWRSHASSCLRAEAITSTRTLVVLGLRPNGSVACSTWVSLPDMRFLPNSRGSAFLQHVSVAADCRGNGLGARLVGFACCLARSHGTTRVLLAASDQAVRERFYTRVGFQPLRADPWLMWRDLESTEPRPGRDVAESHPVSTLLRAGSVHDLATAQSLCAQPHWQCSVEGARWVDAEECEEEFCGQFRGGEALGSVRARQFLVLSQAGPVKFASWSRFEAGTWRHRILLDNGSETLTRELSDSLARVLEELRHRSDEELRLGVSGRQFMGY